jgi:hypothetical protein
MVFFQPSSRLDQEASIAALLPPQSILIFSGRPIIILLIQYPCYATTECIQLRETRGISGDLTQDEEIIQWYTAAPVAVQTNGAFLPSNTGCRYYYLPWIRRGI